MQNQVTTLIYIAVSFFVGFVMGGLVFGRDRNSNFQNRSEAHVTNELRSNFPAPDYHLLNHVTIQLSDGTTQIDHILVSRFGVFVIETKAYSGWLFAGEKQREWTQVLFHRKFKFQNPLLQNFRHVCAVRELLDFLPAESVRSAVVFMGDAQFKTEVPNGGYDLSGLIDYLRKQTQVEMSLNRMQFCIGRLEANRLAISGATDVEHVESLGRRHGRTV